VASPDPFRTALRLAYRAGRCLSLVTTSASMDEDQVVGAIAPAIQRYLDGDVQA
jgi:hypothetical protein